MATLKRWDQFFSRTDLTTTNTFQVVGFDLSNPTLSQQNQRVPITQLLRAGENLSDLLSVSTALTNIGLGTSSSPTFFALNVTNLTANAGTTGFNITGSNPACNVGTNATLGSASGPGQFFTNSLTGDVCLRDSGGSNTLRLGSGTGASGLDISTTQITANVPVTGVGLAGDVTGTNTASVVSFVGGSTAALVHSAELLANAATSANTASAIVRRDSSGLFNAGGASFAAGASNFNITGTNQSCNVGTLNLAQCTSSNAFFTGTANGDCVIRQSNSGNSIYMGVTGGAASFILFPTKIYAGLPVTIGSGTIDASAILEATTTTQGFLPPRMTTTQKNAISSPAQGLIVFDTTLAKLCVRGASAWETITST